MPLTIRSVSRCKSDDAGTQNRRRRARDAWEEPAAPVDPKHPDEAQASSAGLDAPSTFQALSPNRLRLPSSRLVVKFLLHRPREQCDRTRTGCLASVELDAFIVRYRTVAPGATPTISAEVRFPALTAQRPDSRSSRSVKGRAGAIPSERIAAICALGRALRRLRTAAIPRAITGGSSRLGFDPRGRDRLNRPELGVTRCISHFK